MSRKNIFGIIFVSLIAMWWIADAFADAFAKHGWWAVPIVLSSVGLFVMLILFINWLFD